MVGPTMLETREHDHAENFPCFDRRRIPDTEHASPRCEVPRGRQVFEDEVLPGTETADHPPKEMA